MWGVWHWCFYLLRVLSSFRSYQAINQSNIPLVYSNMIWPTLLSLKINLAKNICCLSFVHVHVYFSFSVRSIFLRACCIDVPTFPTCLLLLLWHRSTAVRTVFLLIRAKRGVSPTSRLDSLLSSQLFDTVKARVKIYLLWLLLPFCWCCCCLCQFYH